MNMIIIKILPTFVVNHDVERVLSSGVVNKLKSRELTDLKGEKID